MNMSAEIQSCKPVAGSFRFVAEPKVSKPEGRMLGKSSGMQVAVMVATDQKHFGIQSLVQISQISPQALGDTEWAMD